MKNNKTNYSYGWVPDAPDQSDFLYKAIKPVERLKNEVDLTKICSSVENQGRLDSCTAQALAGK